MKLARTFLIPYLKRFWLMLISVIFVGAFGCSILIGLRDAYYTLTVEIKNLIAETGFPDLYFQTIAPVSKEWLSYLPRDYVQKIDANKVEFRASYNTTFVYNEESYSCKVFSYDDEGLLKHHLIDGEFTENGLRMEYYFADANKIGVGNEISLKMYDGSEQNFKVESTFVSAETSVVKADPYGISSSRDFAYIFLPKQVFENYVSESFFNEVLIDFVDGLEMDGVQFFNRLLDIAKEQGVELTEEQVKELKSNVAYMSTYDDAEAIDVYRLSLAAIDRISSAVPAAFFLIVLLVTSLFLFQIVRQCRKDIGILRALGERKRDITFVFVFLALVVAVISWIVGVGLGVGINAIANYAYGTGLKLYPLTITINIPVTLIALGAMVFVSVITSLLASLSISKIKPVEAMKALPPMNNKTPFLVRTVFKNTSITMKISISQTLRNIRRYILSGLCLLASGMMIFVAMSLELSKKTMIDQLYGTRMNYDVQVYFDNMPTQEDIMSIFDGDDNITDKTLIKYLPSEVKFNDIEETLLINGISNDQDLVRVVSDYDDLITVPDEGIVLCYYHADLLKANVGDIIIINDTEVEVKAISKQFLYQISYMSFNSASSSNERGSLLARVKDVQKFFETYKNATHVSYIAFNEVIKQEYNDRLLAFSYSSYVLNVVSIILGFMIVFNMMQTNLKEQKRTFSTIRTLGYQRSSISLSNLVMSLIQYIFSMVFAIPVGIILSKILLNGLSNPKQFFPFPRSVIMYVLSSALVLLFLLISHFIAMSSMKKWNLPEAVKERE